MPKVTIIFLGFLLLFFSGYAQKLELLKAVPIPNPQKVSIDRYNNIYFADERGNVYKHSPEGDLLLTFSPQKKSDVTLLEAWRNVNIFIFYRNFQEATLLDRFLTQSPNFRFDEEQIGFVRLATYASDNNFWVIDDRDFSLKKYNSQFNKLELNTSLDLLLDPKFYDLNFMREYQNLLFVADKSSGVLVFDNMGNYKNTLPFKGITYFSFLNNEIYFLENNKIKLYDIYKSETRIIELPAEKQYLYALIGENKIYMFSSGKLEIYKMIF